MKKRTAGYLKQFISCLAITLFLVGVSGCKNEKGPMEKAGKEIDKSIEATKDTMKDAGETIQKGAEQTAQAAKDAAEKVEEKVKE
jgi:gas vesicle protein